MRRAALGRWAVLAVGGACAVWAEGLVPEFPILYSFAPFSSPNGLSPWSALVQGEDGNFYGTNSLGGAHGHGTVFRVASDGSLATLVSFDGTNGSRPLAGLTRAPDGSFYGTTSQSAGGGGTVFRMTPEGGVATIATTGIGSLSKLLLASDGNFYGTTSSQVFRVAPGGAYAVVAQFGLDESPYPMGDLVQGTDGHLYGTTRNGGSSKLGSVFRLALDGTLTTLASFSGGNGARPEAGLLQAADGNFYGTTSEGGDSNAGTVFRMTPGGVVTTLVHFTGMYVAGNNGHGPKGELIQASDGLLYGTTFGGGEFANGTIFRMNYAGVLSTVFTFHPETRGTGSGPSSALLQAADGGFYGTTHQGGRGQGGTVFRMDGVGNLETLVHFSSSWPGSSLVQDHGGKFYGTTYYGGSGGQGTVFRTTVDGRQETIANFNGANGAYPEGGVTFGVDGNLYGTTRQGGIHDLGTVFRLTPDGDLTTLVHFNDQNGKWPMAALTLGSDGTFYGTTGSGSVFRMTHAGVLTPLAYPGGELRAPLVEGSDGNFYGTTASGGPDGEGVVFRMTPQGALTSLASFRRPDYYNLLAGGALAEGLDGAFYGTTIQGGDSDEGVVFRVTKDGAMSVLMSFSSESPVGRYPWAGLMRGLDGALYGTTTEGGVGGAGTVFRVDLLGAALPLVNFRGSNGGAPESELMQAADLKLYGTTRGGGDNELGTVYRIDIVPDPFEILEQLGVDPDAIVVSAPVVVTDFDVPVRISVDNGQYSIGCTGTFTALPGDINPGQEVCVQLVAPSANESTATATLTVGGVSSPFKATTRSASDTTGGGSGSDTPSTDPDGDAPPRSSSRRGGGLGTGTVLTLLLAGVGRRRGTSTAG